jgi:pimeloyl-ACP methyl ester carboxylesterase
MPGLGSQLFLPGFAAQTHAYARGLPDGWEAAQPPPPRVTRGSLRSLREWAVNEVVERPGRTLVAGHSMGAALAVLAAPTAPDHFAGLVLIAPAGLPLRKPVHRSARDLARQLAAGVHPLADTLTSARELGRSPRGSIRLVRALRELDLSAQMRRVRAAGIPTTVIGCSTDTLVTPEHCRRAATLLGGRYRELELGGGHVWMLHTPRALAELLARASR